MEEFRCRAKTCRAVVVQCPVRRKTLLECRTICPTGFVGPTALAPTQRPQRTTPTRRQSPMVQSRSKTALSEWKKAITF
jgi:hypothetical protein